MGLDMSKLFNLKEWLSLEDAAKRLSIDFDEDVSVADVLRLGQDKHLRLSVHFVNYVYAKKGEVVEIKSGEHAERDINMMNNSPDIGEGRYLNIGDDVFKLSGVYDLAMIGCECLDVEDKFHSLQSGPAVTLCRSLGAFVKNSDGSILQLQNGLIKTHTFQASTKSGLEKVLVQNGIDEERSKQYVLKLKENHMGYLLDIDKNSYCPSAGLPKDCVLVVKISALRELEQSLCEKDSTKKTADSITETERSSLLKLVLGMAVSAYSYDPISKRNAATGNNKGSIVADLERVGLAIDSGTVLKFVTEGKMRFSDLLTIP